MINKHQHLTSHSPHVHSNLSPLKTASPLSCQRSSERIVDDGRDPGDFNVWSENQAKRLAKAIRQVFDVEYSTEVIVADANLSALANRILVSSINLVGLERNSIDTVSLNCLVYGDKPALSHIFCVDTAPAEKISDLRYKIWESTEKHVSAKNLVLYTPTTAISTADEASFEQKITQLDLNMPERKALYEQLNPTFKVSRYTALATPEEELLHILVVVPSEPVGKRKRMDSDDAGHGIGEPPHTLPPNIRVGSAEANPMPSDLLDYYYRFWGAPLDPTFTTLPNRANAMEHDDDGESSDEDSENDVLPGEPFLDLCPRILVRAEYIRVFDAVKAVYEEFHDKRLAMVTGQPGIGKTLWIRYALRRCLGEKQPVVWYRAGNCYFFSESGLDIINPLLHQSGTKHTWCFKLFPIYVTSPEQERWRKLRQLRIPTRIIMDPWTLEEIEKASELYPNRDLDDIRERFYNAGPSPRLCFEYDLIDIDDFYRDRTVWINASTAHSLAKLIDDSGQLRMDEVSHSICVIKRPNRSNLRAYVICPVTLTVRRELRTQVVRFKEKQILDLLQRFSRVPTAGGMTGAFFEAYIQQAFTKKIEFHAYPMFRTSNTRSRWHAIFGNFSTNPQLQKVHSDALRNMGSSVSLIVSPKRIFVYPNTEEHNKKLPIEEDVYYILKADNAVGIDALIVHSGYLYLFQFTGGSMHCIKSGLEGIHDQFTGLPHQRNWRFIFIVPKGLASFACPYSNTGFLRDHLPYTAQVTVD
ncbi:hypothetical protein BU17DRAFT_90687 [Hysterangium stoloniferum]|nr:hypothetical protein BU17DRAFT_90687 [Hysterangium stoloniferum]